MKKDRNYIITSFLNISIKYLNNVKMLLKKEIKDMLNSYFNIKSSLDDIDIEIKNNKNIKIKIESYIFNLKCDYEDIISNLKLSILQHFKNNLKNDNI